MRARFNIALAGGVALVLIFASSALLWGGSSDVQAIQFANGRTVKVLATSFGTVHECSLEEGVRGLAARLLPRKLRTQLGLNAMVFGTTGDSLMLLLKEYGAGPQAPNLVCETFRILGDEKEVVSGLQTPVGKGCLLIEFRVYDRAAKKVPVEFHIGEEKVSIRISNRGKATKRNWTAGPLPQTNSAKATQFVLKKAAAGDDFPLRFQTIGVGADTSKWMNWRGEWVDAWGNWGKLEFKSPRLHRAEYNLSKSVVKVVGRPTEYISAGMTRVPRPGECLEIEPEQRARDFGIVRAWVLGAGRHQFRVQNRDGQYISSETGTFAGHIVESQEGGRVVASSEDTSFLFLIKPTTEVNLRARLRERKGPKRDGRIFEAADWVLAKKKDVDAALVPEILALYGLQTRETAIEAEIVVGHAPTEFFIDGVEIGLRAR